MKKLFAPFMSFALAAMLLSSCSNSSKLAFTKRHYRSGHFVDLIAKTHTAIPTVATLPVLSKHSISQPAITTPPKSYVAINTPVVLSHKTEVSAGAMAITANSSKQALGQPLLITESPITRNNPIFSDSVGSQGDSSGAARDGLSLLWIVIVVILILWLIGLIAGGFGLGGLINILLIIALILLILWLLRVW
jgi:Family of unknown function (DUF5670)